MEFELTKLLRENIKNLKPYSSARSESQAKEGIFLDANENGYNPVVFLKDLPALQLNRYPDPLQSALKEKLSELKKIPAEHIFVGNGSDEAIDLVFRAFCKPGTDNVIVCPPTYGMYEVAANINDVEVIKIPLLPETFELDTENILKSITLDTKLIFFCSPNNPTGNSVKWSSIKQVLDCFNGIVIVDEAYIDFTNSVSLIPEIKNYPNLVILQTLSKAWGLAGLRTGLALGSKEIIAVFNKIKAPYNVNVVSQQLALEALDQLSQVKEQVAEIISARNLLGAALAELPFVLKVYPSEANFLLVKINNATKAYNYLMSNNIVVRNRSAIALCEDCLRISIGTTHENQLVLTALKNYKP